MINYIIRRLISVIPVLIGVTLLTFILFLVVPGDPVRLALGQHPDPDLQKRIEHQLGMDKPWPVRYVNYVWDAMHGDLGYSIKNQEPVSQIIGQKFPATLQLSITAMLFAILVGIPAGVISATKQYSLSDNIFMILALVGVSMPIFVLGLLLLLVFVSWFKLIPGTGYGDGNILYIILPTIALGTIPMAIISRMTRSSLLEVLKSDYVRTAKSKGLSHSKVVFKHAFRNALIPIVTVVGNNFASLMAGAIITEKVFNWPGIGTAMIVAIEQRDYPVVMGLTLFLAVIFVTVNLVVDLSYSFIDPRVRLK
ncbi:MAG: ABC transporter permease [Caldisericia bacterium]|nr:ABC transporter permease [Caldisericia bacterium]